MSLRKTRAVVVDANPDKSGLHVAWALGAARAKLFKGFDKVVHAKTWEQAMADLVGRYDEIQFYGHALPGGFCIGDDRELTARDLSLLADHVVNEESLVWLRGCSAFHGEKGQALARRMVAALNCRVAAHTYIIGLPWHSGGHSLRPGQEKLGWSVNEGKSDKPQKSGWMIKSSGFFEPNTLSFLATNFPAKW